MARIELQDIDKSFGGYHAIRSVSTTLRDGGLTVIVGPSGSGKTTLLRSIAGLESIDGGRIGIDDRDVTRLPPKDRDVAFVFQNYALYPQMTVRDNIAFPLRARKVAKAERRRRAEEVAERLGLTVQLDRKPGELSGGQQQRVAIGRAIIREPSVFLFDEPLSNLDAQLRIQMRQEIMRLRDELGATAVWVTHDQEEAMAMGDEIIVFNEGRIAQQAPPDALYGTPQSLYVARSIGSPTMNLFAGTLRGGAFAGEVGLSVDVDGDHGDVIVGVRPEDVQLAADVPEGERAGTFTAVIELVELLGPRAIVTLAVAGRRLTAVLERRSLSSVVEGAQLDVTFARRALHVFDAGTELRIPGTSEQATGVGVGSGATAERRA